MPCRECSRSPVTSQSVAAHSAGALAAIGAAPVFVGAWSRKRAGQAPVAPDPSLGHAADYLRMSIGVTPDPRAIAALDAVTLDEVAEVARDIADTLAIACVGPHSERDFS
ncbi:MAG: hypothetical protein KY433_09765 [Actinobacteria bacterium]|nr:hypothetical protein [Actinomycetota bacterium]